MSQDLHGPDHYIPDEERRYDSDEENDREASIAEADIEAPPADTAEQRQAVEGDDDDDEYR